VVVEAGATWSDVLRTTLAQGKTPPVLTDYLELSVGGTLTVGGVGWHDLGVRRAERQRDRHGGRDRRGEEGHLLGEQQRRPVQRGARRGSVRWVSITKATLKLVAAPESVRRFLLVYPDLATMLRDERLLSADH